MTNKEIKILLEDFFEEGDIIGGVYSNDKYLYVIRTTKDLQENGPDDRVVPERHGVFEIEKETQKYKEIHPLFFPRELLPKEPVPTLASIAKGIMKRQFINERDFLYIAQIFYGEDFDFDFNYGKLFHDHKYEREIIRASFKDDEIRDRLAKYLKEVNIKSLINEDGWLIITRVPEKV